MLKSFLKAHITAWEMFENKRYMQTLKEYLEINNLLFSPAVLGETISEIKDATVRKLLSLSRKEVETSIATTTIKFGTSGWRGVIGTDFTFRNVQVATRAVISLLKTELFQKEFGLKWKQIQQKGILVGRDTRFMGEEFADVIIKELQTENIQVYYAGVATTPELSAAVITLETAGSINITPSHNPFIYAGFKFNPPDGGPAENQLTDYINEQAKILMDSLQNVSYVSPEIVSSEVIKVDTIIEYEKFLVSHNSPIKNIEEILVSLQKRDDYKIVINSVGGAGACFEKLFRKHAISPDQVEFILTKPDITFRGGMNTEPQFNFTLVKENLHNSTKNIKLGFVFDPDGDRVSFYDGTLDKQIEMNFFLGAVYFYIKKYLNYHSGFVAKSVATSNFLNKLVELIGEDKISETAVGFKHFRGKLEHIYDKEKGLGFLVAGEESDGMSIYNHTFEKDGFCGILIALHMFVNTGKTIGTILLEAQNLAGYFYPEKGGLDVALSGEELLKKLSKLSEIKVGQSLEVGNAEKIVKNIITVDGYKIIFQDDSWFMVRPSGTEPKVRFYVETRDPKESEAMFALAKNLTLIAINN